MNIRSRALRLIKQTLLIGERRHGVVLGLAAALMVAVVLPAGAVDGVIEINQTVVAAAGGFPYSITVAGSYRLTSNLLVSAAGTNAINVLASPVTIDLNGFAISGVDNTIPTGIRDNVGQLTVKNGTIQNFGIGINSVGPDVVLDLTTNNTSTGIFVFNALVRHYTAQSTASGVGCGGTGTCLVTDCLINATATGINLANTEGTVRNCVVNSGTTGIGLIQGGGTIIGNTINLTTSSGAGINALTAGPLGYGANTVTAPAGATCFSGGTSMGNNVCNGTVQ
jgi:hypothetical protein